MIEASGFLQVSSDGSSLAVPALSDARPVASHVDHVAGVKDSVTEEMIELESCAVDGPVVTSFRVVEMVTFRRENCEVLNVTPCQMRTAHRNNLPLSATVQY